ncbi:CBS domain-containing protein [Desulfotomaculum arcticum]|uniref:CBS domain-containing protein n=1 Tax=Desulfotruncus arcticus DSM 17038 TaxID=1121424 RepID=A0A1I2TJ99_9FIRM|nr:CBS domain-containing protein [Desulfotruncus arcticus]SFG64984.1 CBS domain-containing protein [Desulfotomaculum arcticum] [Desulfotruncus arcticus DSM 17038]
MRVKTKTAADIMVPIDSYVTINKDATLYEAIIALRGAMHSEGKAWHGHRSVLVLGDGGKLVGILTMSGLLRAAGLKEIDDDPEIKAESWGWYYVNQLREETKMRVRDFMRPLDLYTVDASVAVIDIALTLLKYQVNSLPVLKQGKPVGIVRSLDVFMVIDEFFH